VAVELQEAAVVAVGFAVAAAHAASGQAVALGLAHALWLPVLHVTHFVLSAVDAVAGFWGRKKVAATDLNCAHFTKELIDFFKKVDLLNEVKMGWRCRVNSMIRVRLTST
jgi:hypothetical protein